MSTSFTKLFASITESTVWCEPDRTRLVWICMLAMADRNGYVGASVPGLANRARVPVADCEIAINTFLSPDPYSRTPDHEGRRIMAVDGGWILLNHDKYREAQNDEVRLEQKRRYINERRARERAEAASTGKPEEIGGGVDGDVDKVDASRHKQKQIQIQKQIEDSDASIDALRSSTDEETPEGNPSDLFPGLKPEEPAPPTAPDCPHLEILALWAKELPELPQHLASQWKGTRALHLRARWKETAVEKGWRSKEEGLAYFSKFFRWLRGSPFLMGKVVGRNGRAFETELAWVVNPTNWAKTHEGKYHG